MIYLNHKMNQYKGNQYFETADAYTLAQQISTVIKSYSQCKNAYEKHMYETLSPMLNQIDVFIKNIEQHSEYTFVECFNFDISTKRHKTLSPINNYKNLHKLSVSFLYRFEKGLQYLFKDYSEYSKTLIFSGYNNDKPCETLLNFAYLYNDLFEEMKSLPQIANQAHTDALNMAKQKKEIHNNKKEQDETKPSILELRKNFTPTIGKPAEILFKKEGPTLGWKEGLELLKKEKEMLFAKNNIISQNDEKKEEEKCEKQQHCDIVESVSQLFKTPTLVVTKSKKTIDNENSDEGFTTVSKKNKNVAKKSNK